MITQTTAPSRPQIPHPEEIYNSIMRGIEPELTTEQFPLLKEIYKNEEPSQKAVRIERYKKSFQRFDEEFQEAIQRLTGKVNSYRRHVIKYAEAQTQTEEEALRELEQAFS